MKGLKKILSYITKVEYAIMIVTFAAMVIAYFISVVNRNIIKASMPWTEEIALYSMTYMALLGTEVGLRDGTQVAVTAVIDKLHGVVKRLVSVVEQMVLEIFSFVMLKAGTALFLKQIQTGQTTPVLKLPMAAMYFSLVLAFGLIFVIQAVVLVEKIGELPEKKEVTP
ncbi:MAG: TRAP transporter small permease [Clostridium sp.]|nr:TRAP transporter small permease [Clostridium sp.]